MKYPPYVLLPSILFTIFTFSVAQLPLQQKPKTRGFPGKCNRKDGIAGRGVIEPMYRLNNTFIPSHYDIEVRVILDNDSSVGSQFTAPGKIKIVGVNQDTTSRIVLHSKNLTINESLVTVAYSSNPGLQIDISGFSEDKERDFFIIELATEINAGEELVIYMEHVASIILRDSGLFYRTYENEDGETRRVAATQFQSVDARRVFPCFDEPALKATFELTVIRKENYTSLSNTELVASVPDLDFPGWVKDKYAPTVKMSSYLVAFVVSDFDYVEAFFGNKSTRVYAPKHMIEAGTGNYSANVAAKCLNFYEEYLNETYKLTKLDSVAVPEFSGAMENYGLNIYGTSYLLFLPGEQSESDRNLITLIIAHELAHQWFGNLVTMKWWNELFLNEGISTYVQYLGMEAASPEFMGVELAILDAVQYSMLYDARSNTHPLSHNVSTPDEIEGMFSTISYEKGASIIRMMEGFLTRETLQTGLQKYLKMMAYNSAEQDDLFGVLQETASMDDRLPTELTVPKIMHTWTEQSGFPLVKVDVINETAISFSQERFKNHDTSDMEGRWYIPITMATEDEPHLENNVPKLWLENDGVSKSFLHNSTKWIIINNNATGYYRTLYNHSLAQLIQKQLESNISIVNPLTRSQLIDDYFVLAKQKYINIQAALNFTKFLHHETHFTVWSTFFEHFDNIYTKFSSHPGFPVLQGYLLPKIDSALLHVGLEETAAHKGAAAILRADLLDWSCSMRSRLCKEYALKLLVQWQADLDTNPITSIDAKETLQCAMVAEGGRVAFDLIFNKYQETNDTDLREEFLKALACATDIEVLESLLNKTLDTDSGLRLDDVTYVLARIAKNPIGRSIILKFTSQNIDYLIDIVGNGQARPVGAVLSTLASYYTTQAQLDQIQVFVDKNVDKLITISPTVQAVIGVIRDNISWMGTTGFDVWTWLWFV